MANNNANKGSDIYKLEHTPLLAACSLSVIGLLRSLARDGAVNLVLEATVLVLAEERETNGGQCVGLQELEALFEGVVDFDLAGAVEDNDASGSVWRIDMLAKTCS